MSPDSLIANALAQSPPDKPVWIALSGGLDSSLLLTLAMRAAHRSPRPIYALHVNHGLQPAAGDFERHCRVLCSNLGVPLFIERVQVESTGQGIEAAARKARYMAFARRMQQGESLWLAQHADDQAETLLLAALRGSGVRGLAGMLPVRQWWGRYLMRPLLACLRSELEREARSLKVEWVEDPTNLDTDLDRNFLRRRVVPLVTLRWPEASRSLAQSAHLAGEADELLDELAALDLTAARSEPHCIQVSALRTLSAPRQRLLIRYACQRLELPTPPAARLATLLEQLGARDGAQVRVVWPGAEARYWRDGLYLQAPMSEPPANWQCDWDGRPGLMTPVGRIEQGLTYCDGISGSVLRLSLRQGGESLRVAGRGRRDVKRLLQEAAVPPWQRSRQLMVWHEGALVAVLGVAVAPGWEHTGQAPVVS